MGKMNLVRAYVKFCLYQNLILLSPVIRRFVILELLCFEMFEDLLLTMTIWVKEEVHGTLNILNMCAHKTYIVLKFVTELLLFY